MNQGFGDYKQTNQNKKLHFACVVICWDLSSFKPGNFSGEIELKNYLSDTDPSDVHPSPLASFKFYPFLPPSSFPPLFSFLFLCCKLSSSLTFHCGTRKREAFLLFSSRRKPSIEINIIPAERSP